MDVVFLRYGKAFLCNGNTICPVTETFLIWIENLSQTNANFFLQNIKIPPTVDEGQLNVHNVREQINKQEVEESLRQDKRKRLALGDTDIFLVIDL